MEENLEGNKGTGKTIIMVLLMMLVIGLAIYIVIDKVSSKKSDEKINKKEEEKELNVTDPLIENSMAKINFGDYNKTIGYLPTLEVFYETTDKRTVSDMNIEYLINNVVLNMEDSLLPDVENTDDKLFLESNFKSKYEQLYGLKTYDNVINILKTTGVVGCPTISYNEQTNLFSVKYKCDYNSDEYIKRTIVKAEETDKELYIYEKVAIMRINKEDRIITLYNHQNVKIDEVKIDDQNIDIITAIGDNNLYKNINKFDQYKYIFIKDNKNNYYFNSVQLIK